MEVITGGVPPPHLVDGMRVLGLCLYWTRDKVLDDIPSYLMRLLSYCGKLVGHFLVCGWLHVGVAYIKRRANLAIQKWDDARCTPGQFQPGDAVWVRPSIVISAMSVS